MLPYLENYKFYEELVKTGKETIYTKDIDSTNLDTHFTSILNIMKDGIETDEVQNMFIHIVYTDNVDINLHIFDYWFNLMMWTLWTSVGKPIDSEALFFDENITKKSIKYFEDHAFIKKYRDKLPFISLNNIPERSLRGYSEINNFAYYLSDTVNMEDTIDFMNEYPEFAKLLKPDMSDVKIEDIKNEGTRIANEQIKFIKEHDHCLTEAFKASEAINAKQFQEVNADIGTKPNGEQGVYPISINASFINGGLSTPEYYYIESSVGRQAQILQKTNVAVSGDFARLLGTNNLDTWLHPDPDFFCDTKHLVRVTIKDSLILQEYNMRFYKETLYDTEDKVIDWETDNFLIGKTIYVYSPMTCASFAHGKGICRRCYGNLYYVNRDINPGKMASDLLSSRYTQTLLSAKHLLQSSVIKTVWSDTFDMFLVVSYNAITLRPDLDFVGYRLKIDGNSIDCGESEDSDAMLYEDYINWFDIVAPDGTEYRIQTQDSDDFYISKDLNDYIRLYTDAEDDEFIYVNLDKFKEIYSDDGVLFLMKIRNNELAKTLESAKRIIDKSNITSSFDYNQIIDEFIRVNNEGNISLNAVHYEVIISNQIRDSETGLLKPDWSQEECPDYVIRTLNQSLSNNPSITVQLEYKRVSDTLYKPISFRKSKPSFLDLYFMRQPQEYINNPDIVSENITYRDEDDMEKDKIEIMHFTNDSSKPVKLITEGEDDEEREEFSN